MGNTCMHVHKYALKMHHASEDGLKLTYYLSGQDIAVKENCLLTGGVPTFGRFLHKI